MPAPPPDLVTRPAVVTIDLHRGHLDPAVATMPLAAEPAQALLATVVPGLARLRAAGVPVVHVVTSYRSAAEITGNPYWRAQAEGGEGPRARVAAHNLDDGPGIELMPGVLGPGDVVVATKKRYDCFVATDLDLVLASGGHDSVMLMGVNTNSCVLATAIAASVRDYAVMVLSDCVDSMMGPQMHEAALAIVAGSFGWVLDLDEALAAAPAGGLGVAA